MDGNNLTSSGSPDLLRSSPFRRAAADEDYIAALEARSYIDTAIGIVMGKHDCTRDAALAGLERMAAQFNITTFELAKALTSSSGS